MAATEFTIRPEAETRVQKLSDKVTRQVSEILGEASRYQAPKTYMVYRMPAAGVRYYF